MSKLYVKKMLENYNKKNPVRFHMPGHKGTIAPYDVTEVSITDNLNNPTSHILDAEKALSKSYKTEASFFLVNGSTGGIHTMLKYVESISSKPVLISRNSHKSVAAGCILFNINTIVVEEQFNDEQQAYEFNQNSILEIIKNTELAAVFLTPVDYFGRVFNIKMIYNACKEKEILVFCDEAHGAHFHISSMLPDSTLQYADICVHSPHKTLSALTQCAYIHISKNINQDKFKNIMYSLQTSSPSFLLVQSMDNARYNADHMKKHWEKRIKESNKLREKINNLVGIQAKDRNWAKELGYRDMDPTRLVLDVSSIGSGIEIAKLLEDKYHIFMEMASFKYIVAILTPWDKNKWDKRLFKALKYISKNKKIKLDLPEFPVKDVNKFNLKNIKYVNWETVKLKDSINRISAVSIGSYPPGTPLVLAGEKISKEIIEYMNKIEQIGGSLYGTTNGYINCIKEEQ